MEYVITLEQMEFRAFHGCYELERRVGNRFAVDLSVTTDLGRVAEDDDVTQAVSYLTMYEIVAAQMKRTQCTIEAVAVNIISNIKDDFPQVLSVKCSVSKLAPPLGGKVARATVTLEM